MQKFVSTPHGLTLIEMMGVIAVSAILLSGAWNLFRGGMQSYQRGLQEVRLTQGARTLLTLVTRDVQRAMATRAPYGIRGTPQQTAQAEGERHADHLVMLTAPPPVAPSQAVQPSGTPQRIRYIPTTLSDGKTLTLQRAVVATSGQQSERVMPVHDRVQAFYLRYFDGQVWYDEWQQAELPRALEITVVIQGQGPQSRAHRFATLITAD